MAEINKLSDKKLKSLQGVLRDKEILMADGKGLSIRVSKAGHISWVYAYRLGGRDSRLDRVSLGSYPDVGLKLAREKRDECRTWLAEGCNPKTRIKEEIDERLSPVTVRDALEYWITEYADYNRSDSKAKRNQFEKHIYPFIGDMALKDIETRHWLKCFDRTRKQYPVAAGNIMVAAKQAMKFCGVRRYGETTSLDMLTVADVGKKANKKDRVLDDKEIGTLWKMIHAGNVNNYHARLLKFLLVFGCRTHEVRLSKWKEWDFDELIWTVPKENSKGSNKIVRPIPPRMAEFLKEFKGDSKAEEYILGELKSGESVSQMCRFMWRRLKHGESWTPHDLRRTFSTKLNDLGVAPHVVEQLLGHVMGGVMAVYNRSQYLPEKRAALDVWMDRLVLLGDKADNVSILSSYAALSA